jgi:hypothetical protein
MIVYIKNIHFKTFNVINIIFSAKVLIAFLYEI